MIIDIPLRFKTTPDYGDLPEPAYAKEGDAGLDLHSVVSVHIFAGETAWVRTGLMVEIPKGFAGIVLGRSGNAKNKGLLCAHVGLIDSGFRGELLIGLKADGFGVNIGRGDRVGQLLLVPFAVGNLMRVEELAPSERGTTGFGSTGG